MKNNLNQPENETPEEKAKRIGVPLIPEKTIPPPSDNPTIAVCGKCGRELKKLEFYFCQKNNCPTQKNFK